MGLAAYDKRVAIFGQPILRRKRKGALPDVADQGEVQRYLVRLHVSNAHLGRTDMVQALRDAGAPKGLLKAAHGSRCAICEQDRRLARRQRI